MVFIPYTYIIMKKWETKKVVKETTKIIITLEGDDVAVAVHWNAGQEKEMADYLVDGTIPTFSRIMEGMEVPDDLKLKIYTKWLGQIANRLQKLNLHSNDEEEDG